MPAFNLDGKQIWQTIAHIRSFHFRRAASSIAGDPAKGRELFRAHNCARCHESNAPDLGKLARNRSTAELRRSVEDPNADKDPAWWRIQLTLTSGQSLQGRHLNEDTHSIQFLDNQGKLAHRGQIHHRQCADPPHLSPMPSYRGKLQEDEWNHLLAYLISGDPR